MASSQNKIVTDFAIITLSMHTILSVTGIVDDNDEKQFITKTRLEGSLWMERNFLALKKFHSNTTESYNIR